MHLLYNSNTKRLKRNVSTGRNGGIKPFAPRTSSYFLYVSMISYETIAQSPSIQGHSRLGTCLCVYVCPPYRHHDLMRIRKYASVGVRALEGRNNH